jgi:hypothetical protein
MCAFRWLRRNRGVNRIGVEPTLKIRRIETMTEQKHESLSREEQAFLIKILWEALLIPPWSRDDLIEFGKAIFGKTPLKDLDPKKFNQLFPFLKQITDHLGIKLKEAVLPTPAQNPAVQGGPATPDVEEMNARPEDTSTPAAELDPLPHP